MVLAVEELRKDLEEFKDLQSKAQRIAVKAYLETEIKRLTMQVQQLEKPKIPASQDGKNAPKRYVVELTTYAWDQSDKFVKIFIDLNGIQDIDSPDENVITEFTEKSLKLSIINFKDKDYRWESHRKVKLILENIFFWITSKWLIFRLVFYFSFIVTNLLGPIVVDKSYRKVKTDMVAIYMKKAQENKNWSHLTSTAKQLKDMKDNAMKDATGSNDPSAGLMNLMKKMYDEGTPEMKQTIAKAWTESTEKRLRGEEPDFGKPF